MSSSDEDYDQTQTKSISKKGGRRGKTTKQQFLTGDRKAKFTKAVKKILHFKNQKMKDILRANKQSMSGNKQVLYSKIAHGMAFGRIPPCTNCGGGRPKFNLQTGEYTCIGYQDDTDYVECNQVVSYDEMAPLMLKWEQSPIQTEESEEENSDDDFVVDDDE